MRWFLWRVTREWGGRGAICLVCCGFVCRFASLCVAGCESECGRVVLGKRINIYIYICGYLFPHRMLTTACIGAIMEGVAPDKCNNWRVCACCVVCCPLNYRYRALMCVELYRRRGKRRVYGRLLSVNRIVDACMLSVTDMTDAGSLHL